LVPILTEQIIAVSRPSKVSIQELSDRLYKNTGRVPPCGRPARVPLPVGLNCSEVVVIRIKKTQNREVLLCYI